MEEFILILLVLAVVVFLIYYYGKTRSIMCMQCGKISNLWNTRNYYGTKLCKECFSKQSFEFGSNKVTLNSSNITVHRNSSSGELNDLNDLTNERDFINSINSLLNNNNTGQFKSTRNVANFIAVNENDKTWSLFPFNQVFNYSDLAEYSIEENTVNDNNTSVIDVDNTNNEIIKGPLNQIKLAITLKDSTHMRLSFSNNNSFGNSMEEITSILELIKNNA